MPSVWYAVIACYCYVFYTYIYPANHSRNVFLGNYKFHDMVWEHPIPDCHKCCHGQHMHSWLSMFISWNHLSSSIPIAKFRSSKCIVHHGLAATDHYNTICLYSNRIPSLLDQWFLGPVPGGPTSEVLGVTSAWCPAVPFASCCWWTCGPRLGRNRSGAWDGDRTSRT